MWAFAVIGGLIYWSDWSKYWEKSKADPDDMEDPYYKAHPDERPRR